MKTKWGLIIASLYPISAYPQTPPDPQVKVPVSLLQKLVDAGQEAPGKVINPLTDQVRQIINDQLQPKTAQNTPPAQPTTPPGPQTPTTPPSPPPPETPQGVPPHHPLPPPVQEQK